MSKSQRQSEITPLPRPANAPRRKVFVQGLTLDAHIGVYESEQGKAQPVRIDFEADVFEPANPMSEKLEDIFCYDKLTQSIKAMVAEGHVRLVETLAERIADLALSHPMTNSVTVRVTKLQAIPEAEAVGVEIVRTKI